MMISKLEGTLIEKEQGRLVVSCAGVGYEVWTIESLTNSLPTLNETVKLDVRLIWREDGPTLYGFEDSWSKRLFDLLLSVSGVGPKAALALLGALGSDALAQTIANGDSKRLQSAPGIGTRTAQRIVVDLGDKIPAAAFTHRTEKLAAAPLQIIKSVDEAIDTLIEMGFKLQEAQKAVDDAAAQSEEVCTAEELIRAALKKIRPRA